MALALILIGIVVAIFLNVILGIVLIMLGIILLFVPAVPYGYSDWRGRRRGPP